MDFESRVRDFLMYASDSWVSLLAVEFLLLSGIACELFVIVRARSYPPGVLVVASLCGVLLPVTPLALASRQALTSERAALAALPGSGLDAGMAVVELSHYLTLGDDANPLLLDVDSTGSIKGLTLKGKKGLKSCGKATVSGVKADKGVKAEEKCE